MKPSRQTASARRKAAALRAAGKLKAQGRPRWKCPGCGGSQRRPSSGKMLCAACFPRKFARTK